MESGVSLDVVVSSPGLVCRVAVGRGLNASSMEDSKLRVLSQASHLLIEAVNESS